MKRIIILMIFMLFAGNSHAITGNVNLGVGAKFLHKDWKPQETQLASAVIFDIRGEKWPISIAADYSVSVSMIDRIEIRILARLVGAGSHLADSIMRRYANN